MKKVNLDLIKDLVSLEAAMYSGNFPLSIGSFEIKLIYNFFIMDRMQTEKVEFESDEIPYLLETVEFEGLRVPMFISLIDKFMGGGYFRKVWTAAFADEEFEFYLLSVVYSGISKILGERVICLPLSIQTWFSEPSEMTIDSKTGAVPKLMKMLRRHDPEFAAKSFDEMWSWFLYWSLKASKDFHIPPWLVEFLNSPDESVSGFQESCFNFGTKLCREFDLEMKKYSLSSIDNQKFLVGWFLRYYLPKIGGYTVSGWFKENLDRPVGNCLKAEEFGVSRCTESLMMSDPNLKGLGFESKDQCLEALSWHIEFCRRNYSRVRLADWQGKVSFKYNLNQNRVDSPRILKENPPLSSSIEGVNLIGWPFAEIGIGEDIRVAALSLLKAGLPFRIVDAAERLPPKTEKKDLGFGQYQAIEPTYPVDIVFLDASTQYRYYCFDAIKRKSIKRRIIGVCPWELSQWPKEGNFALSNLDYFFAATKYIYNAFEPFFKEEQIFHVPPAVYIPEEELCPVVDLERDGVFQFLTIFDGYSSIHRKNPVATIKAFQLAFPPNNRDVRLVVKMMNTPLDETVFKEIVSLVRSDDRISIINKTLIRSELFALIRASDCFVSLHRSEGFGRNIAESMLLGRPVICSAYSGNLDFCNGENSFLVEGEEIPVATWMYSFSRDQKWYEPSVEHAAIRMKAIYEGRKNAMKVALAGQEYISRHYSLKAMGDRYSKILERLS